METERQPTVVRWKIREADTEVVKRNLRKKDDAEDFAGFLLIGHCSGTGNVGRGGRNEGACAT